MAQPRPEQVSVQLEEAEVLEVAEAVGPVRRHEVFADVQAGRVQKARRRRGPRASHASDDQRRDSCTGGSYWLLCRQLGIPEGADGAAAPRLVGCYWRTIIRRHAPIGCL